MLTPEQFETHEPLPSFTVPADRLWIGDLDVGPADVPASFDDNWSIVLQLGSFVSPLKAMSLEISAAVQLQGSEERMELLVTRRSFSFDEDSLTIEARPARLPMVLVASPSAVSFKAVLLSPPDFIKKPIKLLAADQHEYCLTPFASDTTGGCILSSNQKTHASDPLQPLETISYFLTFMKGSNCGLGNLHAYDSSGEIAYRLLGFSKDDRPAKRETNWFDIEIQNDLPAIFDRFSKSMEDKTTNQALRQAINFYRASNASREVSIEMAIIAAHSSLEAIVNYILASQAGWSKSLMAERSISFSDKLRAATGFYRLDCDILTYSPALIELSKKRNGFDAYGIISFIRNKLVHQDAKYTPTGIELHEAWLIAQWLVEVLIFGVIGYSGKMIDRRVYRGWRGTTCTIPTT